MGAELPAMIDDDRWEGDPITIDIQYALVIPEKRLAKYRWQ